MTLQFIRKLKREKAPPITTIAKQEELKKYIFIIDEINRGEISKIFGELFFAVDPGYRGKAGEISTQYANLHSDPNEKFYIPENVYIIGTHIRHCFCKVGIKAFCVILYVIDARRHTACSVDTEHNVHVALCSENIVW